LRIRKEKTMEARTAAAYSRVVGMESIPSISASSLIPMVRVWGGAMPPMPPIWEGGGGRELGGGAKGSA